MTPIKVVQLAQEPGIADIIRILDGVRTLLVGILVGLSVAALTYAGVRYVASGGDPMGVEKAKGAVRSAVVGFALAFLAPVLIGIVKHVLGG
jgi:NO-binding membrane sensor protein with MHYT domain